jgi:hypothetical protein
LVCWLIAQNEYAAGKTVARNQKGATLRQLLDALWMQRRHRMRAARCCGGCEGVCCLLLVAVRAMLLLNRRQVNLEVQALICVLPNLAERTLLKLSQSTCVYQILFVVLLPLG